jgi:hypothetical protein
MLARISNPYDALHRHQQRRFDELHQLLEQNPETRVVIAGNNQTHRLGTGIARASWGSGAPQYNPSTHRWTSDNPKYTEMLDRLTQYCEALMRRFGHRVEYGNVGFRRLVGSKKYMPLADPSNRYIHVWGANPDNWNNMDRVGVFGKGQAQGFDQLVLGVFGIVTMCPYPRDRTNLLEWSKYSMFPDAQNSVFPDTGHSMVLDTGHSMDPDVQKTRDTKVWWIGGMVLLLGLLWIVCG